MTPIDRDYQRIVEPLRDRIISTAWRITRNAEDAEDALQEAMVRLWARLPKLKAHPHPEALALRICANAACDIVRRSRRRQKYESAKSRRPSVPVEPDHHLVLEENRCRIAAALARLPEKQATAVVMRHLMDCSHEEIAAALGCAEATSRVHVVRGLERLRSWLSDLDPICLLEQSP